MIEVGASVKVERLSGKYSKYAFHPRREGKVIEVDGDKALLRFLCGKRDTGYYYHDHWFYIKDLKEIHHRKKAIVRRPRLSGEKKVNGTAKR